MLRAGFLFLLGIFAFLPQAAAEPSLDISLSKNKIQMGENAELQLQVSWPKTEGPYRFGIPQLQLQNLSLTNQGQSQEIFLKDGVEWTRKIFIMTLAPTGPGKGLIKESLLSFVDSNAIATDGAQQLQTPQLEIQITKPPFQIPFWIKALLGGLGILAAGFLTAGLLLKNRGSRKAPEYSPENILLKEFQSRVQAQPFESNESAAALSKILHDFLAIHYQLPTSSRSELEMIQSLEGKNLPREEIKFLQELLGRFREAMYTGQQLSEKDFQYFKSKVSDYLQSKQMVSQTS